jgi:lipopolysaccharide/colanic/teichoic acid biosynthesis glycosyltransferase
VVKGLTDRVAAFLIILLLSPALFLVAAAIRLDSPGHPVFTQIRVGKNGRLFNAYKFRTMQANNDDSEYKSYLRRYILHNAPYKVQPDGEKIFKVVEDRRVTRVGGFLRRFNLDELPQLVNIFLGQMSFIGPRPDIPYCVEMYSEWQRQRLSATPGITGLWQVGHRKGVSFDEMVKIDLDYIARISPILDFKITVLTIRTILLGDGS